MREPPERRDGLDLVVSQTLLVATAALVTAPALVIAVPLALVIDRRRTSTAPSPATCRRRAPTSTWSAASI